MRWMPRISGLLDHEQTMSVAAADEMAISVGYTYRIRLLHLSNRNS